jgi:hypothetical protein
MFHFEKDLREIRFHIGICESEVGGSVSMVAPSSVVRFAALQVDSTAQEGLVCYRSNRRASLEQAIGLGRAFA